MRYSLQTRTMVTVLLNPVLNPPDPLKPIGEGELTFGQLSSDKKYMCMVY